jgi:hypothetical protein
MIARLLLILTTLTPSVALAQQSSAEVTRQGEALRARYERGRDPMVLAKESAHWRKNNRCFEATRAAEMVLAHEGLPAHEAQSAHRIILECATRDAELALAQGRPEDAIDALRRAQPHAAASREQRQLSDRVRAARKVQRARAVPIRPQTFSQVAASEVLGQGAAMAAGLPLGPIPTLVTSREVDIGLDQHPSQRQLQECAARLAVSHWLLPTLTSLSRMGLQGLVLHEAGDGLDEAAELPLLLRLPFSSKEIRVVPQWNPNAPGARVRIRF